MEFKSLTHLLDHFKLEETAIKHYEQIRWNGKPVCPHCQAQNAYVTSRGYKCSSTDCLKKFTVKVGTIFENSKIPFRTWFAAIYLMNAHKKGISSVQLGIDLGITQKSAWFLLHRIRETSINQAPEIIEGNEPIEADESVFGGKEENRHKGKKRSKIYPELSNDGKPYNKKRIVVGLIERKGNVILKYIPKASKRHILPLIEEFILPGKTVFTDESKIYKSLPKRYNHATVIHSENVYKKGNTHTNTIENFWSVLKRGLHGIYHQVSSKHFNRYLHEYASRFNSRQTTESEKFEKALMTTGTRLTYKKLIANA